MHDTASNEAVTKAVKEKRNSDAVQEIEVREGKFLLPQIVEASIKPFTAGLYEVKSSQSAQLLPTQAE